uniref:Uncharacterized protein n=1 Tax=Schistocephalus solidus TaxID=70667 RepID=A0A183T0V3_SCHSO
LDRSPPRHLPDEAPTATPTKAPSNQITEKLEDLHAPDDNATVETRWCQLRNVIQSTALDVLGRAHRRHQDWFDDNDADISIYTPRGPIWAHAPPRQPAQCCAVRAEQQCGPLDTGAVDDLDGFEMLVHFIVVRIPWISAAFRIIQAS